MNNFLDTSTKQSSVLWVIDGSLKDQLHKNARLKPAMELVKSGWKVRMITSGTPDDSEHLPITFMKIPWPNIYLFGVIGYYLKTISLLLSGKIKTDILFFQMDSFAFILLVIPIWQKITNKQKYRVVVDYRSLPMDTQSLKGKLRSAAFYLGVFITKYLDVKITAITAQLSEALKVRREQLIGLWPSGAELDDFSDCYGKRRWPEKNEPIRLIYLGVLTEERNLISVIKAAGMAKMKGTNLTVDIVGSGPQKEDLKKRVRKNRYDFINIHGPYPYHSVPDLLSQYDIGILPFPDVPKMNVSSAIKMFEYMAAGMPVLATRIQAHTNVFKDMEFVFWCAETPESMAKAIKKADRSKESLPTFGKNAKDYSRNWSWEKSAKELSIALRRITT
ncbi:MAG: glycosyltransferase [Desulfobacteraceae bacterium]|nr:glycosyltransferase [Desulfobacteraceae bacterium]